MVARRFWYTPITQVTGTAPFPSGPAVTSTAKAQEINLSGSEGYTVSHLFQDIRLSVEAGVGGNALPDLWWGNLHFGYSVRVTDTVGVDAGAVFNTEDGFAIVRGMLRMYNPPHVGLSGGTLATWWGGFSIETEAQRRAVPPTTRPDIVTGIQPVSPYGFDNFIVPFNYHWEMTTFTRVLYVHP